jgi:ATP-binding cassette subfamily B (MDR/TAP) protein 1
MLATLPLTFGTGRTLAYFITKYTVASQHLYAHAGSIAEQAFQSIRTVYSFSLESRFSKRYDAKLEEACQVGVKKGIAMGIGFGTFMGLIFCTFGLSLWRGSSLVVKGEMDGPSVFVAFLAMMMGKIQTKYK